MIATTTVKRPSRRKIQRQPSRPAIPSILAMAKARRPEKAPPVAAEVYRIAIRVWVSLGRYQFEMIRIAPGRKPALGKVRVILVTRFGDLLKDTEKEADGQETGVVLNEGSQSHDDTPAEDYASHVY